MAEPIAVPEGQRGTVFLRRQLYQTHLSDGGPQIFNLSHFTLLHPTALQLGNVTLTWNPTVGAPTVHRLKIIRDGEETDVLDNTSFEILRREDQLEAAHLDGLLTASLRVPDLRVGDELEFAYTVPASNPTLRDMDFGTLYLLPEPTEGRVQLRLSWDDPSNRPRYRITPDIEASVEIGDNALILAADDFGPVNVPRSAPARYSWQRIIEYTDFADWRAVSSRFDTLFDEARTLDADSPLTAEAARIARVHDTDMARAQAALDLVTQQVRYIYVGLNDGAFTPAGADATWDRRYGDCKGKTALLLALLDELGITAEAVLVSNSGIDDGLDAKLPSPGMFDHVLVRATIDGESYWLDGTLPGVARPTQRPVFPYKWVLPLADGGAELEEIGWQPLAQPQSIFLYEIDARAGFDEPAAIEYTVIARGLEGLSNYMQFSAATDTQLENIFRNNLAGSSQWDTIEDVEWRYDQEHQASILRITGTGPIDWEEDVGNSHDLSLPGGGFNPPSRRQRDASQDQNAPYLNKDGFSCHVTTVRYPDGTKESEWSHNSTFDTDIYATIYRRMFERTDRTINMIRMSRTQALEISAEQAERDNARLPDFDNSRGRIFHSPGERSDIAAELHVPGVKDVDWVENPYACHPDYDQSSQASLLRRD